MGTNLRARSLEDEYPKPTSAPQCPRHNKPMDFNTSRLLWNCVQEGCRMIFHSTVDLETGKPVIAKGKLEIVATVETKDENPHIFIRAVESNILIDVTDYVDTFNRINETLHKSQYYELNLHFDTGVKLDGHEAKPL